MNESTEQERQPATADGANGSGNPAPTSEAKRSAQSGNQVLVRGERQHGRGKRGSGRGKPAYAFTDGLEHCYCRNATRVPPEAFPVAARTGVATAAFVELARTDRVVLLCDLLHEGPHMWPDGDEFVAEQS